MVLDNPDTLSNQIYDIYVIKHSGLPLFAGCTVSDYCKAHMGQHELISGFFSALFSFSKESFDDESLETMVYGDILLNFWEDTEHNLIVAFVHDRNSDVNLIRDKLQRAHSIFIEEYADHIDSFSVDQAIFDNFRDILYERGIINNDLVDTSGMVKNIKDKHEEHKPSIVGWLKGLFGR